MSTILIAPTEPAQLKLMGTVSPVPEKAGVDVIWPAFGGLVGVQRKEVGDLFTSIDNGRLNTELAKARSRLKASWLVVEGPVYWTRDGRLAGSLGSYHRRWTLEGWWGFQAAIQASGTFWAETNDLSQTCSWIEQTVRWSQKTKHESLLKRPNPKGKWGRADSREWAIHLLSGFPGVSVGKAVALLDGGARLKWNMSEEELMGIKGIGPKLAKSLTQALAVPTVTSSAPDESGTQSLSGD